MTIVLPGETMTGHCHICDVDYASSHQCPPDRDPRTIAPPWTPTLVAWNEAMRLRQIQLEHMERARAAATAVGSRDPRQAHGDE
jgi:hypothetical protein